MAATVNIIFRKDKMNARGEAPLHIRIIKNRKINNIATGHKLEEKYWDETRRKVKPSHPTSARLNNYLSQLLNKYQDEVLSEETANTSVSGKSLKKKLTGDNEVDFYNIAKQVIEGYHVGKQIAIYNKSKSILGKIKEFCGSDKLPLEDINVQFLKKYELYFRKTRQNKNNTIEKDLAFIRRVFSEAYQMELIAHEKNPFNKYSMSIEKTKREFLTEEELARIINLDLEAGTRTALHRDIFVFSCCGGGLRISDILLLRWSNFDGTHIQFGIKKTKGQLSIKLPNPALEIINRYKTGATVPTDFIFPMLNKQIDFTDAVIVHNAIGSGTAVINKSLKTIAKKAEITKPLTTHIARHTFATRALTKGMSLDKVGKVLGHANIRETQIYAKIVNKELDMAMDVFND